MGIPRWMRIRGMFFWAREKKTGPGPGEPGKTGHRVGEVVLYQRLHATSLLASG